VLRRTSTDEPLLALPTVAFLQRGAQHVAAFFDPVSPTRSSREIGKEGALEHRLP
jgi:hypothetical protein